MNDTPSAPDGAESRALDIDAIRERCEKATPGPWAVDTDVYRNESWHYDIRTTYKPDAHPWSYRFIAWMNGGLGDPQPGDIQPRRKDAEAHADAEFIAHARDDVPALLSELDKWRNIADDLADSVRWLLNQPAGTLQPYTAADRALAVYNAAKGE